MKRKFRFGWLVVIIWVFAVGFSTDRLVWQRLTGAFTQDTITFVACDPSDENGLWFGTTAALYRSKDKGKSFEVSLPLPMQSGGVKDIFIDPDLPKEIYTASETVVYRSQDDGQRWEEIFTSRDKESPCLSVAADQAFIYVGTAKGIEFTRKDHLAWQKFNGQIANKAVYKIIPEANQLYVATAEDVYRVSNAKKVVENIFTLVGHEAESESSNSEDDPFAASRRIKDLQLDSQGSRILIATDNGIYESTDNGKTWDNLAVEGLAFNEITALALMKNSTSHGVVPETTVGHGASTKGTGRSLSGGPYLFAGTEQGVYVQDRGRWRNIYQGMDSTHITALATDITGRVYAASDRGVYALTNGHKRNLKSEPRKNKKNSRNANAADENSAEPGIKEVHSWAIAYAEVSNDKIKQWRQAARTKAILPTVSTGIGRSATDLFHWDTSTTPDSLIKGRDFLEWDVSCSWDLGDLIWSTDQTSIDSRAKLMVELREDILAQVTRLYFERLRLKAEIDRSKSTSSVNNLEKQLRLQELTALIDGFTGGKFSERIDDEGSGS